MADNEKLYNEIAESLEGCTKSKMFGALCIKAANGKAGVMYYKGDMVFKLDDEGQAKTLKLSGAHVFEPMAGRKMNGWIVVPAAHSKKWEELAQRSMNIVSKLKK